MAWRTWGGVGGFCGWLEGRDRCRHLDLPFLVEFGCWVNYRYR